MKEKTAYIFPGQGSQTVGMGKDIYETSSVARAVFDQADSALGFPISELCFNGPESELQQTVNSQPAIMTVSVASLEAALEAAGEEGLRPDFVAGHSLGEYCALVAAGVFDFADAVRQFSVPFFRVWTLKPVATSSLDPVRSYVISSP